MKIIISLLCVLVAITISAKEIKKELLTDISVETKKCAVQKVSNQSDNEHGKVVGYKSKCDSLVIISNTEAKIFIEGQWLFAKIFESQESDGGDLNDLIVKDASGKIIARKINIPSYNSVIVAMIGNSGDIDQEDEQN